MQAEYVGTSVSEELAVEIGVCTQFLQPTFLQNLWRQYVLLGCIVP